MGPWVCKPCFRLTQVALHVGFQSQTSVFLRCFYVLKIRGCYLLAGSAALESRSLSFVTMALSFLPSVQAAWFLAAGAPASLSPSVTPTSSVFCAALGTGPQGEPLSKNKP